MDQPTSPVRALVTLAGESIVKRIRQWESLPIAARKGHVVVVFCVLLILMGASVYSSFSDPVVLDGLRNGGVKKGSVTADATTGKPDWRADVRAAKARYLRERAQRPKADGGRHTGLRELSKLAEEQSVK